MVQVLERERWVDKRMVGRYLYFRSWFSLSTILSVDTNLVVFWNLFELTNISHLPDTYQTYL